MGAVVADPFGLQPGQLAIVEQMVRNHLQATCRAEGAQGAASIED